MSRTIITELKDWKTKLIETWLPLNGTQEGVDWFKARLVELEVLIATHDNSEESIIDE